VRFVATTHAAAVIAHEIVALRPQAALVGAASISGGQTEECEHRQQHGLGYRGEPRTNPQQHSDGTGKLRGAGEVGPEPVNRSERGRFSAELA
jgi:hypothetical protein